MTGFLTIRAALQQGSRLLEQGGVPAPGLTAEVLLCHALTCERSYLYSHSEDELTQLVWIHYGRYLDERLKGKPTQYITRRQEFYGREFYVDANVLIPRPETEIVVETALGRVKRESLVVDAGCGSGAIAITVQLEKRCRVYATDLSLPALSVARANCLRLDAQVGFVHTDLMSAFADGTFDVVISNPPYIADTDRSGLQREVRDYEPALALFAGPTGNEVYLRLIRDAARVLRPRGTLVLELGYNSLAPVSAMLQPGWQNIEATSDLAGIPRVLTADLRDR